jgi:zinc protease
MKGNALRFETQMGLLGMLNTMSSYNLTWDYIKKEEAYVKELTTGKVMDMARKHIDPTRMYYVVVGDAKTQMDALEEIGFGKPVMYK